MPAIELKGSHENYPKFVYSVVDNRAPDRYDEFLLFYERIDAMSFVASMGKDSSHFIIHRVEMY